MSPSLALVQPAAAASWTPRLEIDLDVVAQNWRRLRPLYQGRELGAVVKADAYGLGLEPIARRLHAEGCDLFWVGGPDEGLALRRLLPQVRIFLMQGLCGQEPAVATAAGLVTVVSSLDELQRLLATPGGPVEVAVLLDCGLNRLGLSDEEATWLAGNASALGRLRIQAYLTQLGGYERPGCDRNRDQLARFLRLAALLPPAPLSIASSAVLFMDRPFHLDLARVGSGLYGVQGTPGLPQPIEPSYRILAPVLRVATVPAGTPVGYGDGFTTARDSRIATLAIGYGDGLPATANGRHSVDIGGFRAPVVGRVSMSLTTVDVTEVPQALVTPGTEAEVLGPVCRLEELAVTLGLAPNALLLPFARALPKRYIGRA